MAGTQPLCFDAHVHCRTRAALKSVLCGLYNRRLNFTAHDGEQADLHAVVSSWTDRAMILAASVFADGRQRALALREADAGDRSPAAVPPSNIHHPSPVRHTQIQLQTHETHTHTPTTTRTRTTNTHTHT